MTTPPTQPVEPPVAFKLSNYPIAINLVVAILCLLPGYYFYHQGIKEPVPTFSIDPARAPIVEASGKELSDLAVTYRGKALGDRDVTAVRVYFWNNGREPMRESDVLKPFQIVLAGGSEILDYRMLKESREITGLALSADDIRTIRCTYKILEQGDGAAVQIIFAGPQDAAIHFDGVAVGAPKPSIYNYYEPSAPYRRVTAVLNRLVSYVSLTIGIAGVFSRVSAGNLDAG
jgi:hypothetical protein